MHPVNLVYLQFMDPDTTVCLSPLFKHFKIQ